MDDVALPDCIMLDYRTTAGEARLPFTPPKAVEGLDNTANPTILLCRMIPPFSDDGNLPPGIHEGDWAEIEDRFATNPHRRRLLGGFRAVTAKLAACGCERVYLDGSFVSNTAIPADFDGAWELSGVDLRKLRAVEPLLFDFSNRRAAQKAKYLGEMFPAEAEETSSGRTFIEFFQEDKSSGQPKGLVTIDIRKAK